MKIQERNQAIKKLNEIQERVNKGTYTQEDYQTMLNIILQLTRSVKID